MIGSAALRHLSSLGGQVIGIGTSPPRGEKARPRDGQNDCYGLFSSHQDEGRIARCMDRRDLWSQLARRSIARYLDLARESGVDFWDPRGALVAFDDAGVWKSYEALAQKLGMRRELLGSDGRFAGYRLAAKASVIHEIHHAGVIRPLELIAAQKRLAQRQGALCLEATVQSIEKQSKGWRVQAGIHEINARKLLLCTGPYLQKLHGHELPAKVWPEPVILAEVRPDQLERWSKLPALVYALQDRRLLDCYVVPPKLYPDGKYYFKLGGTHRDAKPLLDDAAMCRWMLTEDADRVHDDHLRVLQSLLPDAEFLSSQVRPCLITKSCTGYPFLDQLEDGLFIAVAGNGYAAKSSDALGELAAKLVVHGSGFEDAEIDMKLLRVPRFGR